MNKPITKVIKSKSSNNAIRKKSDKRKNKTTKSNNEFQTSVVTNHGVYVDNNDEKLDSNDKGATQSARTKNTKPRPGKKCFLTSVLKILSKSTTGTQHPNVEETKNIKKSKNLGTEGFKQKKRYKSRVLNNKMDEDLVILQSKKEIFNTPSANSYKSNEKVLKANITDVLKGEVTSKNLAREVYEGRLLEKYDNPSTVVADDKGIYNFFVDLLETTFSVYNYKTELNAIDVSTSKVDLEIRESVANRLVIDNSETKQCISQNHFYCMPDDQTDLKIPEMFDISKLKQKKVKKLKSFTKKQATSKKTRASRKLHLINSIKEELQMATRVYEEPQNIFKALKIMAKNKRRNEKTIQFNQSHEISDESCRFRRRKVICPTTRSSFKKCYNKNHITASDIAEFERDENLNKPKNSSESLQSIKVYGYDYEQSFQNCCEKEVVLTYHSSYESINDLD